MFGYGHNSAGNILPMMSALGGGGAIINSGEEYTFHSQTGYVAAVPIHA